MVFASEVWWGLESWEVTRGFDTSYPQSSALSGSYKDLSPRVLAAFEEGLSSFVVLEYICLEAMSQYWRHSPLSASSETEGVGFGSLDSKGALEKDLGHAFPVTGMDPQQLLQKLLPPVKDHGMAECLLKKNTTEDICMQSPLLRTQGVVWCDCLVV